MLVEKPKWKARFTQILGEKDYKEFMKCNNEWLRRSIRINTLKITSEELKKRLPEWKFTKVPWCEIGFFMEHKKGERLDIGNTTEFQLGYYYGQEAASMIPPLVLNPKQNDIVLDMCAAPGSKTTQMAAMMENKGVLVANDVKGSRLASLGINLQRMGITNTIVTLMQGHWFRQPRFNKILLDAPCSGTGNVRKSPKIMLIWNPNGIKRLAGQQKSLINAAFNSLKKGGILVYSTCSIEPDENEGVIDFLLGKHETAKLMEIKLNLKRADPILEFEGKKYNSEVKKCLRIWPQTNNTGGFFVTKIKKV